MNLAIVVMLLVLQDFIVLPRLQSLNKLWLAPTATNTIGSTSKDHLNRGSVLAIDWTAYKGSYIYPPADSKVIYAGCNNAGGYGCWYLLEDKYGYRHILAHFDPTTMQFRSGDIVKQNDVLGTIAKTGITSWYHVHWELSKDGKRLALENYFDFSKMQYAKIRDVVRAPTKWDKTLHVSNFKANMNFLGYMWILAFILWCQYCRKSNLMIALGLVFFVSTSPYLYLIFNDSVSASDKFTITYQFVKKWEGDENKCVFDPVRTMNGVTQRTYSSYLKSKGLPNADVCREMTPGQAREIYYKRFYLASGADKLPLELALQTFDMSVNAGLGVGRQMVNTCGKSSNNTTYQCYVNYRYNFYKNAKNCSVYCEAWFNRLFDTTNYLINRKK